MNPVIVEKEFVDAAESLVVEQYYDGIASKPRRVRDLIFAFNKIYVLGTWRK